MSSSRGRNGGRGHIYMAQRGREGQKGKGK